MAEELTDEQALNQLNQFVSQWRSFAWIAGILKQSIAARQFLAELDKEKAARQKELDLMAESKVAAENQVKSATAAARAAYTDTGTVKEQLDREMAELKRDKETAEVKLAEVKSQIEHEQARMDAMITEKNKQLTQIRQQLSALKEKL